MLTLHFINSLTCSQIVIYVTRNPELTIAPIHTCVTTDNVNKVRILSVDGHVVILRCIIIFRFISRISGTVGIHKAVNPVHNSVYLQRYLINWVACIEECGNTVLTVQSGSVISEMVMSS